MQCIRQDESIQVLYFRDRKLDRHSLQCLLRLPPPPLLLEFEDLEQALILFCEQIVASANGSSDYKALIRLVMVEAANLPDSFFERLDNATEEGIIRRFTAFGQNGLLDVIDPKMAAKHFAALTFLLVFNQPGKIGTLEEEQTKRIITEGVRVFLCAYAPQRKS